MSYLDRYKKVEPETEIIKEEIEVEAEVKPVRKKKVAEKEVAELDESLKKLNTTIEAMNAQQSQMNEAMHRLVRMQEKKYKFNSEKNEFEPNEKHVLTPEELAAEETIKKQIAENK
jgi:hypothetical protein